MLAPILSGATPDTLVLVIAAAFSYGGFIFVGVPMILLLNYMNHLSLWTIAVAGIFGGMLVGVVFDKFLAHGLNSVSSSAYDFLVPMAICGLVVSLSFGLIAGIQKPLPAEQDT